MSTYGYIGFAKSIGSLSSLKNKIIVFKPYGTEGGVGFTKYNLIIGSSNIVYFEVITSTANGAQTLSYERLFSGANVNSITQVTDNHSGVLGSFTFFIKNSNLYIAFMDWDWDYLFWGSSLTSAEDYSSAYSGLSVSYNIINF